MECADYIIGIGHSIVDNAVFEDSARAGVVFVIRLRCLLVSPIVCLAVHHTQTFRAHRLILAALKLTDW